MLTTERRIKKAYKTKSVNVRKRIRNLVFCSLLVVVRYYVHGKYELRSKGGMVEYMMVELQLVRRARIVCSFRNSHSPLVKH